MCACVHVCVWMCYGECVSGWQTHTFACINIYCLDAGEDMVTRFYVPLAAFGHHELCVDVCDVSSG